ncbi:restriction endonuclease subunit S [Succinimonas sp.]|uniref:restriction endonuclease subunit S n=1 Tax=Succinimonas sp. TaxID=1936151 RepID=UPI00386B2E8A
MKTIKLGDLCYPCESQVSEDPDTLIDYVDISSVDNQNKQITGYQTIKFGEAPSRARKYLNKGNILVSTVRPNLNAVALFEESTPNISVASTGFCVLNCKPSTDKGFLFHYCKSKSFINAMVSQATGASYPAVSDKIVRAAMVPAYTYEEQCRIRTVLDLVSSIIVKQKKELEQLDCLIKARFVEIFGDAVTNPMKWPVKKLKDLAVQINSGNTPKGGSENYVDKGITFFRSQNVWKDRLEMNDIAYIDPATHASMSRSSLKHGDILMTKTGRINTENSSLGRAAIYTGEDDKANVNGHVYFIRLKPEVNNKFVLRILVSSEYRNLIRRVCVGGIDKRQLNKEHIEDFPIICPPSDMVDKYVAFVEQIDKSKVAVQKSLEETQLLFDKLMQEYFG